MGGDAKAMVEVGNGFGGKNHIPTTLDNPSVLSLLLQMSRITAMEYATKISSAIFLRELPPFVRQL
jgi:hypothetical protein